MTQQTGFKRDHLGNYIEKDPEATLNYTINWGDWLTTDDYITSSTWTTEVLSTTTTLTNTFVIDDSVILSNTATNIHYATVTVSSGTVGTIHSLANTIETESGLRDTRRFRVKITERNL